jgi:hypothetical protein
MEAAMEALDDYQHPEALVVRQIIGDKVEAPALARSLRRRHRRPGAKRAFTQNQIAMSGYLPDKVVKTS